MNAKLLIACVLSFIVGGTLAYSICQPEPAPTPTGDSQTHTMSMKSTMDSMNAGLRNKKGDEFDKAFLQEMIVHHAGAIQMATLALTNSKHEEIGVMAQAIISAQDAEIAQMETWLGTWYGEQSAGANAANPAHSNH